MQYLLSKYIYPISLAVFAFYLLILSQAEK